MALLRKLNTKAKTEINTGFGTNAQEYNGHFVNKRGQVCHNFRSCLVVTNGG